MKISYKLLCNACLCVGRKLHKITDEKTQKYYLNALDEIPLYNPSSVSLLICWECKALLEKSVAFKEQVQDSYRILQTYTHENLHECLLSDVSRPPRLKLHKTDPVNILPSDGLETFSEPINCLKYEFKEEWRDKGDKNTSNDGSVLSDSSDNTNQFEPDIQDVCSAKRGEKRKRTADKIKRTKKDKRKLNKNLQDCLASDVSENRLKSTSEPTNLSSEEFETFPEVPIPKSMKDHNQKILTIELTYEEMLLERDRESTRDTYLKAEYKCETCLIGFNYKKSYLAHVAGKHSADQGDYICPICKTIIPSIESFTAHYKRHMRSSIDTHRYHKDTHKARVQCTEAVHEYHNAFPCTICDKVFRWKTSLKRHLEKHEVKGKTSSSAAYCSMCNVNFSSICSYQRHMKNSLKHVTQDQLKFICDHCNKRFADKTKLRDHIEEKHLHKTYQCHICLKPSKNRVGLDQHIRNVHKGRPNNKMCHHCGKGFPTKVQLESHIRTHTGERPFICEFCPTTFSQQSNLYKHNRQVHLNIKSKRYPLGKRKDDRPPEMQPLDPTPVDQFRLPMLQYTNEKSFFAVLEDNDMPIC
ncbi:hypothetical protein HW555_005875 [Spodoptera exigua]|uniref:C2H2-type domain-containing protein n=1 Tax=Spodoptera exigua TaxID=7107 RepID=A0A835GFM6_SPOEX|nr:hypothetical protein HW555_005875 [Spodoptera exigua]